MSMMSSSTGMHDMTPMAMAEDWMSKYDNVEIGLPTMITGILGLFVVVYLTYLVLTAPKGSPLQEEISDAIHAGAKTFLQLEYTALSIVAAALFILICIAINWQTGICYLFGCLCSALCGFVGMMICTKANVKTAVACEKSLNAGLRVAFNAGSVMGLTVVSVALILLSITLMAFDSNAFQGRGALAGLGMGASTVSIFARVGGGIFTKAADVGADLVGKVEHDLPEDDIRNPATIADNVGDNVGDVAGMGADLFSSYIGSTVAAALLGSSDFGQAGIALPYWIMLSGLVASVIGMFFVRTGEHATQGQLLDVIRRGQLIAAFLQIGFFAVSIHMTEMPWKYIAILIIGLVAGLAIGVFSEFFTSYAHPMTRSITKAARAGAGNVIIQGLAVGSFSTIPLALIIAAVILSSYSIADDSFYGVALVSCALLSTLGITLATDAYGPVADNAGGIAEMTHMPPHVRENTDLLDALGNTTAAIGKGFAVGSAILTAISLLANFCKRVDLYTPGESNGPLDVMTDRFIAGLLLGAMIPFWFSALTMQSVAKAAQSVVAEVRHQFNNIPGLKEGTAKADHPRCVRMITTAALHAMVYPVLVVVLSPLIVGIGLGTRFLAGFVLGVDITGFMLGFQQSIAGGAWDNGKKFIESGQYGGKGSQAHKAAVVGDTVGDPFKDTSGPALNILIKLTSYNTVVLADIYNNQGDYWWVSLILIGLLMAFVPFWEWMTPEPMRDEKIEEIYSLLAADEQNKPVAKEEEKSPSVAHSNSSVDPKTVEVNVELGTLDLPGAWHPDSAIPSGHFKVIQ